MVSINQTQARNLIIFSCIQLLLAQLIMRIMKSVNIGMDTGFFSFVISSSFYLLVFIIPVILYLKRIDKVNPLSYLKLDANLRKGILIGLVVGVGIFIFLLIKNELKIVGTIHKTKEIYILLGRVLVGPFEEIPFRGFYLQKFKKYMGFWYANLLSSILFALMHVQILMTTDTKFIYSIIFITIVGLWMGYIFKETKSLWSVVIIHSIYDLSIWIIF